MKPRKRRPSLKAVVKQAAAAGLTVTGVVYQVDGTVTFQIGKPSSASNTGIKITKPSIADIVLARLLADIPAGTSAAKKRELEADYRERIENLLQSKHGGSDPDELYQDIKHWD